jgi:hypothetical protein
VGWLCAWGATLLRVVEWRQSGAGRRDKPLGMAVVRGRSMAPLLADGDQLVVRYAAAVRAGDLVLARFPDGTLAVKRAVDRRTTRVGGPGWWLLSDNAAEGVDSRHRGVVADEDVAGVVLGRLWPRPRWLRRGGWRPGP